MRNFTGRLTLAAIAALALLAPAVAPAASTLPPENSAANQYTESIPTGGGKKDADGANDHNRSPDKVLGAKQADELRAQGPSGRDAAEVAAETAPQVQVVVEDEPEPAPGDSSDAEPEANTDATGGGAPADNGGGSSGAGNGGGGNQQPQGKSDVGELTSVNTKDNVLVLDTSDESSGLSSILSEATGSSSGQLGLLLPLMIVAVAAWALFFAWRQRHQH